MVFHYFEGFLTCPQQERPVTLPLCALWQCLAANGAEWRLYLVHLQCLDNLGDKPFHNLEVQMELWSISYGQVQTEISIISLGLGQTCPAGCNLEAQVSLELHLNSCALSWPWAIQLAPAVSQVCRFPRLWPHVDMPQNDELEAFIT